MVECKYLILGAGPAGLSFANRLLQNGEDDFLVLEKEAEAGGLCRSMDVDGAPLDIGGGHFLDVRRPEVTDFLFGFMPEEEWNHFERDSRIVFGKGTVSHPFEANIWQMDIDEQVRYLMSIAEAGCVRGEAKPEKFVDWIVWKLGEKIAEDYMLPYNRKMFSDDLNELGTYWLDKLPDVSFEDTLRSCLEKKPHAKQPGHAFFHYPEKYGYGEVWLRMAAALGDRIRYSSPAESLDFDRRAVTCPGPVEYKAEKIVFSIPWNSVREYRGADAAFRKDVASLRHSSVEIRYRPDSPDSPAQWLYYADEALPWHRILLRENFLPGSKGCWTETRKERTGMFTEEPVFAYMNDYAYPLNTVGKPAAIGRVRAFAESKGVIPLGRWGDHSHYNSDLVVKLAMDAADRESAD